MMEKYKGWIIVEFYQHKGLKFKPVSVSRNFQGQIGWSGYIYVYPTKKCAELDVARLSGVSCFKRNFGVKQVTVNTPTQTKR